MRNLIPLFIHQQFQQGKLSGRLQAASLFVDLSGFTTLTESLMQYRRDGAEVLTEALGSIFGPLVSEVTSRGGIIPLFAGDAFVALFPHDTQTNPDAPLQALVAADTIQQFFAASQNQRLFSTKYGDFAVGARVGLAYGQVQWGIPGVNGRHLFYFRGPVVNAAVSAQRQAGVGEVIVENSLLPYVHQYVELESVGSEHFRLCGQSLQLPVLERDPLHFTHEDLSPFAPDSIIDMPVAADFRNVCPLFISFQEPQEKEILHAFISDALRLSYVFGGKLSQVDFGDSGALLVFWFGAPVSYENNVARAAEFLLAFQQKNWSVPWRAGLSYGMVWAGIRGGQERCEYGVVGDAVNLACRLALKANWSQILVNYAAYECIQRKFQLISLGRQQLKGKRQEVSVYRLIGKQEYAQEQFFTGTMVGRQQTLDQLQEHIQPIFEGLFGGVLVIYGDAGMGKSRLAYELRQKLTGIFRLPSAQNQPISWFFCPADEILRQSLNPFKRFLRQYFNLATNGTFQEHRSRLEHVLDGLIDHLQSTGKARSRAMAEKLDHSRSFLAALVDLYWDDSPYQRLEPQYRLENAMQAFCTLLQAESLRNSVVLHLEDLHWLDTDSQQMIRMLVQTCAAYPIAILCTSRYQDDGRRMDLGLEDGAQEQIIELETLSPQAVQACAEQILGDDISHELIPFLMEKTGGNPFFVEQLVLDLQERELLEQGGSGRWQLYPDGVSNVPTTINAVLISRLDRLIAEVRWVVQAAAVLGREFHVQVLSLMLKGESQIEAKVKQAEDQRIWQAVDAVHYLFRHALMRDAAYEMQLRSQLRTLHQLAAEAFEKVYAHDLSSYYPDLVYHYKHAEQTDRERHYAWLAGQQAAEKYIHHEAISYLTRALDLTPPDDAVTHFKTLMTREQVYGLQGQRTLQEQDLLALEELVGRHGNLKWQAEVAIRRAAYAEAVSDYAAAKAAAERAISFAFKINELRIEALANMWMGSACWHQAEFEAAQTYLERAVTLTKGMHLTLEHANSLRESGNVYYMIGDFTRAISYYQQSREICQESGHRYSEAMALSNLGLISTTLGQYNRAKNYLELSLLAYEEVGERRHRASSQDNLSYLLHQVGDHRTALFHAQQSLQDAIQIREPEFEGYALMSVGRALEGLQRFPEAAQAYQRSQIIRQELGQENLMLDSLAGLARTRLAQGDVDGALHDTEEILSLLESLSLAGTDEPVRIYLSCYRVLQAAGDERAPAILRTAVSFLQDRASEIQEQELQRSYLEKVPAHSETLAEWDLIDHS